MESIISMDFLGKNSLIAYQIEEPDAWTEKVVPGRPMRPHFSLVKLYGNTKSIVCLDGKEKSIWVDFKTIGNAL